MIAWLTTYDCWLLLRKFAPALVWNFYGDCLTDHLRLLAFAAKLCASSSVKLLRWLPDWTHATAGFCCESLHQLWCETFTVIAWLSTYDYWLLLRNFGPFVVRKFYADCLTDHVRLPAFAAKLCTSSGETFTVIAWLITYDYWLLLRNFAPVLVWNFYGDCLTDHVRLLAFAAKLCASSSVKLLRWLPDWPRATAGFCCKPFHQFWCKTFKLIPWMTTYDYWLLLRNFGPVIVWKFYGDCLTDHLRLPPFAGKLCTSSGVKLLRWLPDWPRATASFCCESLHQF